MKFTVVIDNYCAKSGMLAEWGYCSLLETEHGNVMIDTGGTGHVLRHNLDFLKIDLKKVRALVLSHSHHDHISGLLDIVFSCPGIPIYAGKGIEIERRGDAGASRRSGGVPVGHFPNAHLIEDYVEIVPGVYAFRVPEQNRRSQYVCCRNMWEVAPDGQIIADRFEDDVSLAVKGEKGWSLLLGCAHAGLPNIMQRAKDLFAIERLHMVVGGSHLCGVDPENYGVWFDRLAEFPVEKWRLNHCTGFKAAAAMAARFDDVDWAGVGCRYVL